MHINIRWIKRAQLAILIVIVAISIMTNVYQSMGEAVDSRNYSPPGQIFLVEGDGDVPPHRLHIYCSGQNSTGTPTIILETLSGGSSVYWGWVQPELAKSARVCSYDRAGFGWSESVSKAPDLHNTVYDLHALLVKANVPSPYILVGHSIGGLYVREFAALYPQEVAGIVLLDASHPLQNERHPELTLENDSMLKWMPLIQTASRLGLGRLYFALGGEVDFKDLPPRQHHELIAFWSGSNHWVSEAQELSVSTTRFAQARELGNLGDLPLAVITAGNNTAYDWAINQNELAMLSTHSIHTTIGGATHASLVFNSVHAKEVSAVILKFASVVRASVHSM